jgi:hypothetical protein
VNPAAKLAGFVAVLALVFGGATLAGRALDPFGDEPVRSEHGHSPSTSTTTPHPGGHDEPSPTTIRTGANAPADQHQDHEQSEP